MDNDKIIKNIKERMAISNLEKEYSMKVNIRKQILTLLLLTIVVLSSGFFTVNAATNGELANNIKETVKVWITKDDNTKQEIKGEEYTDKDGNKKTKYNVDYEGTQFNFEITDSDKIDTSVEFKDGQLEAIFKDK